MYMYLMTQDPQLPRPQMALRPAVDVKQSPNAQDVFRPIPGLVSCAGVTGSVGITRHVQLYIYMYMYRCTCACTCNTDGWL